MSAAAVVLAAGKGTRMKSAVPKVLHPICGLPMIAHVVNNLREAGVERILVVVGQEGQEIQGLLGSEVEYVVQAEQLGNWPCGAAGGSRPARLQRPRAGNPR